MSDRKVAIRIGTEGKAQVKSDFAEIRKDGVGAMQEIAASAKVAGDAGDAQAKRLVTSFDRATQDLEAAARRQAAAAAKIASITPKTAVQMQVEANSGTSARGGVVEQDFANRSLGQYEGSARTSALAFRELLAEQDANERAALKLKAAIDPLFAAEQQLARSLAEVALAEKAGVLSADLLTEARKRAQAAYDQMRQAAADAASGTRLGENADAQVRAFYAASAAEADKAQAAALRLKASIDPLWAAEQRLEQELREVALAEKAGVLSADLLAAAQARARKEFDETTNAIKRQAGAGGGLSKIQKQTLLYTASDIIGSSANGINPTQLLIQQGPQVLQAFAAEEGGLAKLRSLLGPVTIGVTALTAAIVIGAKAGLDYQAAYDKLAALADGIGRVSGASAEQLQASAEAGAAAGKVSVATARELETTFLQTGKIGAEVYSDLIAITKDFAAATGTDIKAAGEALARSFADPAKGAEELNAKLGFLDQKAADYIQTLLEQNRVTDAQRVLLDALGPALDGASDHTTGLAKAWDAVKRSAAGAWEEMGKAIALAVTGPEDAQKLLELRAEKAFRSGKGGGIGQAVNGLAYLGLSDADIDAGIAQLTGKLNAAVAKSAQAQANRSSQLTAGVVSRITGADALSQLKSDLGKVNATLGDPRQTGRMTVDHLRDTRDAQDALTHAVQTWIPAQEQSIKLAQLDARAAAAKTPAAKAAIAAERERLQQSGKVVTSAQVEAEAIANGTKAREQASRSGAGHAASLAREAASIAANTRASLDLADAYLKSSAAGFEAEARRKALTDATKKGIDVEARVRAQLAQSVADGAASGARSVAQLRDETVARAAVNDNVAAGTLAANDMSQALSDEAALRPLLKLQAIAQGDAYERLTRVIDAYRAALGEAHKEEGRSNLRQAIASTDENIIAMRDAAEFAGDTSGRVGVEIARRKAEREATRQKVGGKEADDYVDNQVAEARTKLDTDRKVSAAAALKSEKDRLTIANAEIGLVGKSADEHDRVIGRLQLQMQLAEALRGAYDDFAPAILAERDAVDQANAKLKLAAASMDEIRGFASDLLDPSGWDSWGDAGKSILNSLKQEFIKLALLNPLKNLINGNNALPSLGSVFGTVSKLFGGSSGLSSAITGAPSLAAGVNFSSYPSIGFNSGGTEYWSGGATWVGENGRELISAPRGSRITPAAQARQMSTVNDNGGLRVQVVKGDMFDVIVEQIATPIAAAHADGAAARGAAGGAELARRGKARADKYRIRG